MCSATSVSNDGRFGRRAGGPTDLAANTTSLQFNWFLGNGFVTLLGSISLSGGFP